MKGDSEIVEAWFDQAADYWKQAITLTPGNYSEAHNWLKITGRFEKKEKFLLFRVYLLEFILIH
ncbi:Photosystem I assembly protein Ycf3 [Bienertia sinuspersici]